MKCTEEPMDNQKCHAYNGGECMNAFTCGTGEIPKPEISETPWPRRGGGQKKITIIDNSSHKEDKPEAPERIYAGPDEYGDKCNYWTERKDSEADIEYVRADLLQARDARIKALEEENRAIVTAVIFALKENRDYKGLRASSLNYLQVINKLVKSALKGEDK